MTPATGSEAPPPASNAVPAAKVTVQQPPPGTTYRGKPQRSRILRFMGWPTYKGTMELAPTRKTAAYMALAISPVFFYLYDRRAAAEILEAHKERVRHLAEVQLPDPPAAPEPGTSSSHLRATRSTSDELEFPRKVWIMTTCVPDDMEADRGNRWFKTYVKVGGRVLVSSFARSHASNEHFADTPIRIFSRSPCCTPRDTTTAS